jgi:hypothetical protein
VNAMRTTKCQTCAACGYGPALVENWGRGCARDCTQLICPLGRIYDWTEPVEAKKCKECGDLDDMRLCVSREQYLFDGYDVSGRLPKLYMKDCSPKRQLAQRGYELDYGSCMKCKDFEDTCVAKSDEYYHTCAEFGADVVSTCKACVRSNGRDPTNSTFWDGTTYRNLYCQQKQCRVSAGIGYTGVNTDSTPHRICHRPCQKKLCEGGTSKVVLPCVLPHQQRCIDSVNMDSAVIDVRYTALTHTPAHSNILEPATTDLHLFANFENMLVNTGASRLSQRAQCVWNADYIPDNSANPAGISSRFQRDCRPWSRNPRAQYPLMPLQNTVSPDTTDVSAFPRRVLLNTSAQAVAYTEGSIARPPNVFAGDIYLLLNLANTNNATLATFVPDDRRIESANWVPRWRVSVHAHQLAGDETNLSVKVAFEDTCYACFSFILYLEFGTQPTFSTESMSTATASFRGDKFVFQPLPGLFVCEQEVQRRAYSAFIQTQYDAVLSVFFASSLTDACVSRFGIQTLASQLPTDLLRSSEVLLSGDCLVYTFSSSSVYCIRRSGDIRILRWGTPSALSQGTLVDVTVHDGFIVRTVYNGQFKLNNYLSLLSSVTSESEAILEVVGLIMFARGAPQYFLRRTNNEHLKLSKFETRSNSTFSLNATSSYTQNDVSILFSSFVPISGANTILEYKHNFLVFATAKYSAEHAYLYVAVLDVRSVLLTTYSMQFAVFDLTSDERPVQIRDPYERIVHAGAAMLSSTWIAPDVLLLSVAIEGGRKSQFDPLLINITDLVIIEQTLHPDLSRAFDAPFVRVANAVASFGMIKSCSECESASGSQTVSGFFAYGASSVSYKRLDACEEQNVYIEERITKAMPIRSCGRVRKYPTEPNDPYRDATLQMTLACATSNPLEVVLELQVNSRIVFANGAYVANTVKRLLLSVQCEGPKKLKDITAYDDDHTSCKSGCPYTLVIAGFRMQGGVVIQSVRHRPRMTPASAFWDRLVVVQIGLPRADYLWKRIGNEWQEHSVTTRRLLPRQQIDIVMQRDVAVARLAARGIDVDQRIALDALSIVPVLSEHFVPAADGHKSWLLTIVYIPSVADLAILNLTSLSFGDDRYDWARIHASVHIAVIPPELKRCSYAARLVAVDSSFRVITQAATTDVKSATTGCVLDFVDTSQCHIELPVQLANNASVIGVELHALTKGCPSLTETNDISVEFAPFMRISQCPANYFLDVDTLMCTLCDDGDADCPAGQYVRGCRPLLHPNTLPQCNMCPIPNNSMFPPTSRGCSEWQCLSGYYRLAGSCVRCTSLLNTSSASACRATGGLRFQPCTNVENEKCVDCAAKPRYSEWIVTTEECTWRCKDGYFANGGSCERCLTFDETTAALGVSRERVDGTFYRFKTCSAKAQARWEACSVRDFNVEGTYVGDGLTFDEDCILQCANNSNRHSVRVNTTMVGPTSTSVWRARVCQTCPDTSWPVFVDRSPLPRAAFEMSLACVHTCINTAGFFASNDSRTCLFCPHDKCPRGTFLSPHDNCKECQACARKLTGSEFRNSGTFNDAHSCGEKCPDGSFHSDDNTCRPYSATACREGLEYEIAGTPTSDARCGTCADCSGARETVPCTRTSNRECASCGPIDSWSGSWSTTGCQLVCRAADGYTKLYRTEGEVCRKCLPCELGHERSEKPADCSCQPCSAPIPAKAIYTSGCTWTCPPYHVARIDTVSASFVCEYVLKQTSNTKPHLRSPSPVICPSGQHLVEDPRPQAYASFACKNCTTPIGLRDKDLGVTWIWGKSCAWQCTWNLQKRQKLGLFTCETVTYTHIKPGLSPAPSASVPETGYVIGVILSIVMIVMLALCAMHSMQVI